MVWQAFTWIETRFLIIIHSWEKNPNPWQTFPRTRHNFSRLCAGRCYSFLWWLLSDWFARLFLEFFFPLHWLSLACLLSILIGSLGWFFPRLALNTIFPPLHFEFWLVRWVIYSSLLLRLLWSWLLQVFVISSHDANIRHSQKPKA